MRSLVGTSVSSSHAAFMAAPAPGERTALTAPLAAHRPRRGSEVLTWISPAFIYCLLILTALERAADHKCRSVRVWWRFRISFFFNVFISVNKK